MALLVGRDAVCPVYLLKGRDLLQASAQRQNLHAGRRADVIISVGTLYDAADDIGRKALVLAKGKWKIAAKAVTATVSGVVTLTLGEIGVVVFESIFMGDLDINNTDWDKVVENIIKDKSFIERLRKIKGAIKNKDGDSLVDELIELIGKVNVTK